MRPGAVGHPRLSSLLWCSSEEMASTCHLLRAWERIQVELHGRYSPGRVLELEAYAKRHSPWQAAAVALFTPLPCLLTILSVDCMPMKSPREGIANQTFGFWFRAYFTGWILTFLAIDRFSQCHPALHLSRSKHWGITTIIGFLLLLSVYMFMRTIGFPVPFAVQIQTPLWIMWLVLFLGLTWRDILRGDPEAALALKKTVDVFNTSTTILVVYIAYNAALRSVSGAYKTLLSALLPIMKLLFRYWVNYTLLHEEDLAPCMVVLGVDAFHALCVSLTMQLSANGLSTLIIITVDVAQGLVAFYELREITQRLDRELPAADRAELHHHGAIAYAANLLRTAPRIRLHPAVASPRHIRLQLQQAQVGPRPTFVTALKSDTVAAHTVVVTAGSTRVAPAPELMAVSPPMTMLENAQLRSLVSLLKLLHMTEFYVLIEFAEFAIAALYAIYVAILSRLPNRVYYTQLASFTDTQLTATTYQVADYALLEMASFVAFCVALDYHLRPFSSLRQLGFTLHKHWRMVQSSIISWTFMVMQITLEHFGTDFTFKFAWLKQPKL